MPLMKSWVASANSPTTDFPLNNLPYGVFSVAGGPRHLGVAIGDMVLDVTALTSSHLPFMAQALSDPRGWNGVMEAGPELWARFRKVITSLLSETYEDVGALRDQLHPICDVDLHLPFKVSEYTDFYAGKHHAVNVGTMFRGPENALPPSWLHIPIGYNGRASSVVLSGTDITRPWGQLKGADDTMPRFAPSERFDIELELGAIVGTPSQGPISVDQADANIFGYVLLNDWSARDIQAWEYQPLGPFQSKATATTISPWIVTKAALEPFRCATPNREVELLPHLRDTSPMLYDIDLTVALAPSGGEVQTIARTNYNEMYYSAAQQLVHHTTSGCPMRVGDLLGSGTISGAEKDARGSLLELSWGGNEPITLDDGQVRSFLHDGDRVVLRGVARGSGFRVGFGECSGTLVPAADPM
ncbi:fumarylacetoacetase [Roseovarius aestuarii]|uniref:fumarylacetoacetase n=1 Tax=Roseovarius aestuarii TaxID=475083 RepID=A0A1X7BP28_9RHOB|nr:fumarylacetoacetase [Roseovarius aestuarii]SMC11304.1 Fumarylacetoacetate (FAA) hydrolase family protein [Roseovarius aestuarii]